MYQEKKRSLFFGLPLSFTTYRIEEKVVNIKKGQFLSPLAMRFAAEKVVEAGNKEVMITERVF